MAPPLNNKAASKRDKLSLLSLSNPAILLCQVTGAANPSPRAPGAQAALSRSSQQPPPWNSVQQVAAAARPVMYQLTKLTRSPPACSVW